jgi:putative transposase
VIWEIILRDFWGDILRGSAKYRKCPSWLRFPSPLAKARFQRFQLLRAHLEDGRSLAAVAREAKISYRTLQYWLERYRTSGLAALARKPRIDRGRRRKLSAALQEAIEGLALKRPPLSIRVVCNQAKLLADRLGEVAPTYDLVYDVVSRLPADLVTLAHQGTKAYGNSFDLIYRREAARSNAIWQADHTPLDIELLQSDVDSAMTAKPWLSVILDDYSRAVAGYFLSFESPSSLNTALALTLRQAIWRKEDARWKVCGIPEVLYTDNGSDFTSQHLEQVSADLKIRLVFSTPGVPRGRGRVERFFSTIDQMFLCTLPGFKSSGGKRRLTLAEFDVLLREFILDTYHERLHGETGVAPIQRWEQGGFLPRMPETLEQLDLLLLTVPTARKVHPDGIRFQGLRYIDTTLAAYIGESVMLRYDPRDAAEVRVFYNDRFLCRAICPELAGAQSSRFATFSKRENNADAGYSPKFGNAQKPLTNSWRLSGTMAQKATTIGP